MLIALGGLFLSSLVAASLFPAQSELVFLGLLSAHAAPAWALLLVASVGNVLGALLNWYLGLYLVRFQHRRWFLLKPHTLARASRWFARWGEPSLLLSWAPIIGDPLTLVAGVLHVPFWRFLCWVSVAKTGRYAVLWYGFTQLAS